MGSFLTELTTRDLRRGRWKPGWAFTLLELLVVVTVIALLIAIMLPSYKSAREDARRTMCLANMKHLGVGMFTYAVDSRDNGPKIMDPMGTTAPRTLLSRSGEMINLGLLWPTIVRDPRLYFCPSQTNFSYNPRVEDMPAATIGASYAYAVHIPASESPKLGAIRHLAMASDDFVSRIGDPVGMGRYAHRVGYNVLYTDGSASWYSDPDESIWKKNVVWDDETDDITYQTLYDPDAEIPVDEYGDAMDLFRVWHSFCYNLPDPF